MTDNQHQPPPVTAVTTTERVAGQHDLAWLAKNPSAWTTEAAIELAGADAAGSITAAIERIRGELAPVPSDLATLAEWRDAVDERLRRLAVKIAPGMSVSQAKEWRDVMVDALSDLPALITLTAARRALHRPLRFLNEVEACVREIAAELVERRRLALSRLDALRASLRTSAQPVLAPPEVRPLTGREIRALAPPFRRMGLAQGWLTQSEIDAADVEASDQAA